MKKIFILILGAILCVTMISGTGFASSDTTTRYNFNNDTITLLYPTTQNWNVNFYWITIENNPIRIAVWNESSEFTIYITKGQNSRTIKFFNQPGITMFCLHLYWGLAPYNGLYPCIEYIPLKSNQAGYSLMDSASSIFVDNVEKYTSSRQQGYYSYIFELTGFFTGTVTQDYQVSNSPEYIDVFNSRADTFFANYTGFFKYLQEIKIINNSNISNIENAVNSQYTLGYNNGYKDGFGDSENAGDFWSGAVHMIRTFGNSLAQLGNLEIAPKIKLAYVAVGIPVLLLIVGLIFKNRG